MMSLRSPIMTETRKLAGNAWICHDPWVQKDHAEDPFDAFTHPTHNISLCGGEVGRAERARGGLETRR